MADKSKAADNKKPDQKKDDGKAKSKKDQKQQPISEEDERLKSEFELLVERVQDSNAGVQKLALETLQSEMRQTSSSVTSVPKPLKFLGPHYETLKTFYASCEPSENKTRLADIISVLAMVWAKEGSRECLKFKLEGSNKEINEWGHEYVRFLAGEIGQEYQHIDEHLDMNDEGLADLLKLVDQIVPYFVKSNAEPEACDLLLEVERLEKIVPFCDKVNYNRVCLYLISSSKYFLDPENVIMLKLVHQILLSQEKYPEALRIAINLNDQSLIESTFFKTDNPILRKQMAFMLARARVMLTNEEMETEDMAEEDETNKISFIMGNGKLSSMYTFLAKELDCLEPKTPEDIYKSHLTETRSTLNQNIDSARQNLAATFVNAFVNAGFGSDKLLLEEGSKWIYKNKDHGMMSATASLGMVFQWNVDEGLPEVDKYLYSGESYVRGGALLGLGLAHSGVNNSDAAFALLSEYVENNPRELRIGAILGLGIAYAGTKSQNVQELLLPILADPEQPIDVVSFAALTLGVVFVGTCNDDILGALISALTERDEKQLTNPLARFLSLSLGLLFLGRQDACEAVVETTKTFNPKIGKYCELAVQTCAHAGSGNVLKVQELLKICGEHIEEGKENKHQALAVLGIALVAMGEELGSQMTIRSLDHILQYGDPVAKRAVPLALGLLNISNPSISIMDTLSKLSHDADGETADNAILGLGLIGAGTNNARIGQLLRQLSSYYGKDPNHLFTVRIAQGILFMGKGLITMSPLYSDRLIMSPMATAGLLAVLHSCLDMKNIIFGSYHYLLFFLSCAMQPRMFVTLDESLKPKPIAVRVGTAVDVVAQAGRPKTITGFQTHNTPVLLQFEERAELASDEFLPYSSILEDVVIIRQNPEFEAQ